MFRTSQAMVISKSDLLPYVPFSVEAAIQDARLIQPDLVTILTSSTRDEGLQDWCQFLEDARKEMLASRDADAAEQLTASEKSVA